MPSEATAKIDFRLVPNMDHCKQADRLKRHLETNGYPDIAIKMYHGVNAARTSPSEQLVKDVQGAANLTFGSSVINVSDPGTGPMHDFVKALGAPCVSIGSIHVYSNVHSPNEFARIDLLKKTTKCMCKIMENFAIS